MHPLVILKILNNLKIQCLDLFKFSILLIFRSLAPWLTGMIIAVVIFVVLIPAICSACFHYYYYKHGFDDEYEWSDYEEGDYTDSECDEDSTVSSNPTNSVATKKHKRRFKFCSCLDNRNCKLANSKSSAHDGKGIPNRMFSIIL